MKNVLFLGGGRRYDLAKLFIENDFNVIGYDLSKNVPLADITKVYNGVLFSDPAFESNLLDIVEKESIDLIIPLMDSGTVFLSRLRHKFCNSTCLCSDPTTVLTCYNKKFFETFMSVYFSEFYPTYREGEPFVVKPIFGFSSTGIRIINNDFSSYKHDPTSDIIQCYISGSEYSVDTYFDRDGNFIDGVPRIRTRIAGGEVLSSTTVLFPQLLELSKVVGTKLNIIGPANFQFIVDKDNNIYLFEVNARFGGGFTFTIKSGFDVIKLIKRDYFNYNYKYKPLGWTPGLKLERSYRDHIFERC